MTAVMVRERRAHIQVRKRKFTVAPYKDSWHEYEAFEGDRLVGRLVCFEAPVKSRDCWIHDIWVEQAHRGHGIGTTLLRQAIKDAKAHGYVRLLGAFRAYDNSSEEALRKLVIREGFAVHDRWEATGQRVAVKVL